MSSALPNLTRCEYCATRSSPFMDVCTGWRRRQRYRSTRRDATRWGVRRKQRRVGLTGACLCLRLRLRRTQAGRHTVDRQLGQLSRILVWVLLLPHALQLNLNVNSQPQTSNLHASHLISSHLNSSHLSSSHPHLTTSHPHPLPCIRPLSISSPLTTYIPLAIEATLSWPPLANFITRLASWVSLQGVCVTHRRFLPAVVSRPHNLVLSTL